MTDIIKIGSADVKMDANAGCIEAYESVFDLDFLTETQKQPIKVTSIQKMAFIMAMCADHEPEEVEKMSRKDYLHWCKGFAAMDLLNASGDVMVLWSKSAETKSAPKK